MERMERRLRRWNEWNGGCLVRLTIKEKCHCIYCIVISLNVMVPPEFSFLALYNPQKSNQFTPLSLMLFAVLCCCIHVPVIMPRPICGRAYGEPDYRVLYG
jgi:hypothetical protein